MDYFTYSSNDIKNTIHYYTFCNDYRSSNLYIFKLDTNNYPVFYPEKLTLPYDLHINSKSKFYLEGSIKGSLSGFQKDRENSFFLFINIEMKLTQQNLSLIMECSIKTLGDIKDGFRAECKLDLQTYINKKRFDKFYLLPYYAPNKISSPFEVVINSNNIEILNKYKKSGINYDIIKIDNIFDKLKILKIIIL